MKVDVLMDAIGWVDDDMLQVVENHRVQKEKQRTEQAWMGRKDKQRTERAWMGRKDKQRTGRAWIKWAAMAVGICLVIGGTIGVLKLSLFRAGSGGSNSGGLNGGSGDGGKDGSISYMYYTGPVFPLSAREEMAGISAEREITYDFSPYIDRAEGMGAGGGTEEEYSYYRPHSIVTDQYVLTNTTGEEQRVRLLYPFAGSLGDSQLLKPMLQVNGEQIEATLHIGPYSGGSDYESLDIGELHSWEDYQALIEAGYEERALDTYPELAQPVVVYEISDMYGKETNQTAPTLEIEFPMDYEMTTIFTYGFSGGTNDVENGYCSRMLWIPQEGAENYGESAYLIVLGEDIGDYILTAYVNGAREEVLEDAGGTVTRYETTLGAMVEQTMRQHLLHKTESYLDGDTAIMAELSEENYIGLAEEMIEDCRLLTEDPNVRYDFGGLEDLYMDIWNIKRVMYLEFEAVIPAGTQVEIQADLVKEASIDYPGMGTNNNRNGYDMVTQLGSNLIFTSQKAFIQNTDGIEILDDNFGFDVSSGITEVLLNPEQEHYYIEVTKRIEN